MHIYGIVIAVIAFLMIGIFHPIVIKAEYYFTKKCWPIFFLVGLISILCSLFITDVVGGAALGIFGCSCLWSILELNEQEKRVQKGWFPKRPNKKK